MSVKVGSTTYIKLEDFDPAWRQAVLLEVKRGGFKLAVRVTDAELEGEDEKWKDLTFFVVRGCKFLLVEGDSSRTRPTCLAPHRSLEVDPAAIVTAASQVLESEDAQFATASDDLGQDKKTMKAHLETMKDSSGEDLSSEDSEEDNILRLLSKARSSMTDEGMLGDNSRRQKKVEKSRYPMLDKAKKKETVGATSHLESVLKQTVSAGSQDGMGSLNALVQLEILKALQGKKSKDKDHGDKDELTEEDSDLSSSSSEGTTRLKGAGKALQAYRKGRKAMRRKPAKHVRRYIKEVELFLGVSADVPYQLTDYSKRLSWGKHRSLMRIHFAISHTLQLMLKNKHQLAALELTQLLRALHQCSLDNGDWRTAWLLTGLQDPVAKPQFGGEPQELEVIASYLKAMAELEKKGKSQPPPTDSNPDKDKPGKGRNKGAKPDRAEENLDQ